jgi:hypothetical protein
VDYLLCDPGLVPAGPSTFEDGVFMNAGTFATTNQGPHWFFGSYGDNEIRSYSLYVESDAGPSVDQPLGDSNISYPDALTGTGNILALQKTNAIYSTGYTQQSDGGWQATLFQFNYAPDALLTPMSTPSLALPPSGPTYIAGTGIAADPGEANLYVAAGGVSQFSIGAGGALSPLSPASVSVGPIGTALNLAVSADGKSVYVTDPGDGYIAQFTRQANGTLVPQNPPNVPTVLDADDIVLYQSADAGSFAYVLAQGAGSADAGNNTVYQFTVDATGGLMPNSPPTATLLGQQCLGLAIDPIDQLVLVSCVADDTIRVYSIASDGTLIETAWSPVVTASGVNDLSFFATTF